VKQHIRVRRWVLAGSVIAGGVAVAAVTSAAQTATPEGTPALGQTIRVSAPTLPSADRRITGTFAGVAGEAASPALSIETRAGTRFIPCTLVARVETQRVRRTPLWQKAAWTLVGAYAGLYIGHAVADSPGGIAAEDPPIPHPDRDRATHRRQNRIMIAGAITGGGIAYLIARDRSHWQSAPVPGCSAAER
jgi:hypothetical protein